MWWIATGLAAAVLALPFALRLLRRRAERLRIDRIRDAVERSLSALKQPDGTSALDPPTEGSLSRRDCAVRPQRRVEFGVIDLNSTLAPDWRFQ